MGTEAIARLLDADIHQYEQLHVFCAQNYGPGGQTPSVQAAAKNVFTVGAVVDYLNGPAEPPDTIWSMSGRGPTGDDR